MDIERHLVDMLVKKFRRNEWNEKKDFDEWALQIWQEVRIKVWDDS